MFYVLIFYHSHVQKTYSNEEDDNNNGKSKIVGIIQLSFAYLFEQIKMKREKGLYYVITASYLEVYNEQVSH